jgi:hypothetical protein
MVVSVAVTHEINVVKNVVYISTNEVSPTLKTFSACVLRWAASYLVFQPREVVRHRPLSAGTLACYPNEDQRKELTLPFILASKRHSAVY